MDKSYAIMARLIRTYPDGRIERGSWFTFKKYKTFDSVLNAWDIFKNRKWTSCVSGASGEKLYDSVWQFKPVNLQ